MVDAGGGIDTNLMQAFLDESIEALDGIDANLLQMEERPGDKTLIESIFRPIHSIKGNSSFFGLETIKVTAHELETLLDLIRKDKLPVTRQGVDALLGSTDILRRLLLIARDPEGADPVPPQDVDQCIANLKEASGLSVSKSTDEMLKLLGEYVGNLRQALTDEDLDQAKQQLSKLEKDCSKLWEKAVASKMPEAASQLKAVLEAGYAQNPPALDGPTVTQLLVDLAQIAHTDNAKAYVAKMQDNFSTVFEVLGADPLIKDTLLEAIDKLPISEFASPTQSQASGTTDTAPAPKAAEKPATPVAEEKKPEPQQQQPAAQPAAQAEPHAAVGKTMRVAEAHIDTFLSYVGDLIVVGDMFAHLMRRVGELRVDRRILADFQRANESFALLSNNLQASIMGIRKVSLRTLLQKAPRLMRETTKVNNKEVELTLIGEDTLVDKSMVDLLDAPLTHMVRNAGDHGVEIPEERIRKGKDRRGHVEIKVEEEAQFIALSVSDDGAGINLDALRKKAESIGLIEPGAPLTMDAQVELLFRSGVSTAKQVTEISGRGVGMDVVKRSIESAGGIITVHTEKDKGSVFTIRLPKSVTTQILSAYLVDVAGQRFALPMASVRETFAQDVDDGDYRGQFTLFRNGHNISILDLRGRVVSLQEHPRDKAVSEALIVVVETRKQRFGIRVDAVLEIQQVVLKEMHGLEMAKLTSGAAVMGDGSVVLVLDVEQLVEEAQQTITKQDAKTKSASKSAKEKH